MFRAISDLWFDLSTTSHRGSVAEVLELELDWMN